MSSLRRVVIAFSANEHDRKIAESLVLGFRRENIEAVSIHQLGELMAALDEKSPHFPDVLIAGTHLDLVQAVDGGIELIRALRQRTSKIARVPMFVVGEGNRRDVALIAGATDFIVLPGQVADVVALAHIVTSAVDGAVARWQGNLSTLPLVAFMRAMLTARRTGVLSLSRQGRQGELRFFEGELTALQVGARHGLAGLHQALLWPDAHFDLRAETVVRRQQIAASPAELIQDAERFLTEFGEMTTGIPASTVLERNLERLADCEGQIPHAVLPVLQLFDGVRTLGDVIEDSPFPLAATAKVVARLRELAVVKRLPGAAQSTAVVVVPGEDWPLGGPQPEAPAEVAAAPENPAEDPLATRLKAKTKYKKRQKIPPTPTPGTTMPKIDWSAILGANLGAGTSPGPAHQSAPATPSASSAAASKPAGYAPLLPSMSVKGEITVRSGSINSGMGNVAGGVVTGTMSGGSSSGRSATEPPRPGASSVEIAQAATTVLPVLPVVPEPARPALIVLDRPQGSAAAGERVEPPATHAPSTPATPAIIAPVTPAAPASPTVPHGTNGRSVEPAAKPATDAKDSAPSAEPRDATSDSKPEPEPEPEPALAQAAAAAPAATDPPVPAPASAPASGEAQAAATAPDQAVPIAIPPSGPVLVPVPVPVPMPMPRASASGVMPAQRVSSSATMAAQRPVSASGHVDSGPAVGAPPPRDRTPTQPGVPAPPRSGGRADAKPEPSTHDRGLPELTTVEHWPKDRSRDHRDGSESARPEPANADHGKADLAVHFSDDEEAFFNDDSLLRPGATAEDFSDLDDGPPAPPSFWKRLFGKPAPTPRRAPTSKGVPPPAGKKRKS